MTFSWYPLAWTRAKTGRAIPRATTGREKDVEASAVVARSALPIMMR